MGFDVDLENELVELVRLVNLRRLLEPAAQIFIEKAPQGCQGNCDRPITLVAGIALVCCTFYAIYSYHDSTLRLEALQRSVVEAVRHKHARPARTQVEVDGVTLRDVHRMDISDSVRLRKLQETIAGIEPDDTFIAPFWVKTKVST